MNRTVDLDRQCLALKEAGKSYGAIAALLGLSRSAVAGRFYRMQRKNTAGQPSTKPVKQRSVHPRRPSPAAKRRRLDDIAAIEASMPVIVAPADNGYLPGAPTAVMTAKPGTCRWPVGEPRDADFRFCGAKALDGSSWCADCAARAWPNGTAQGGTS